MQQLTLDLEQDLPPDFARFVVGQNHEALAALQELVTHPETTQALYLWSDSACGRSYLLQACAHFAHQNGQYAVLSRGSEVAAQLATEDGCLIIVDDVHHLSDTGQVALFNAFNRAARHQHRIVLSGNVAPAALALREDLRTRISQALVYRLHGLDDKARAQLLQKLAAARNLALNEAQVRYILHHAPRDPHSLARLVAQLDHASLQRQSLVTVPLVRDIIAAGKQQSPQSTTADPKPAADKPR